MELPFMYRNTQQQRDLDWGAYRRLLRGSSAQTEEG